MKDVWYKYLLRIVYYGYLRRIIQEKIDDPNSTVDEEFLAMLDGLIELILS